MRTPALMQADMPARAARAGTRAHHTAPCLKPIAHSYLGLYFWGAQV